MKIKKLIIKNFRGLKGDENIIEFKDSEIIFLIGKNNAGKSTFLSAYSFFVKAKQISLIKDYYNLDNNIPIEIEAIYEVNKKEDEKEKSLKKEDPDWISKWVSSDNEIRIKKIWKQKDQEGHKQTFNPTTKEFQDGGFGGFDTLLTKYSPTPIHINAVLTVEDLEKNINDIVSKNHIKKLETTYSKTYSEILNGLQNLKNQIAESNDITKINSEMNKFFSEIFPNMELAIYSLPDEGIDITKTLKSTHGIKVSEQNKSDQDIDLKQNGHGIIRQAFFSFLSTYGNEINSKEKQYLILFEEPELYMHPEASFSLRKQLYDLSKNSPYQILCATHSPLMIDLEQPHSSLVRLVKREDDTTKTFQVNFDIFQDIERSYIQMINRFNPHICESFFSEQVVLVEGDTEAVTYRELINRYYKNNTYYILNTGSKSNMQFYQKVLTHFGIKHIIVHDSDSAKIKTKTGSIQKNPMATVNENIWKQIINSNTIIHGIARRYVHFRNFEESHNYEVDAEQGKPFSAFQFASKINKGQPLPCFEFLDDLFGNNQINITQEEIEKKISEF